MGKTNGDENAGAAGAILSRTKSPTGAHLFGPACAMSKNVAAGSSSGMIAARNAAQKSLVFSSALSETAPRVQSLHRDVLRSVPWVKRAFNVPIHEQVIYYLHDLATAHSARRLLFLSPAILPSN